MKESKNFINAKKALETICKNNSGFEFRHEDYDKLLLAVKFFGRGELSGDGGIAFSYSYDSNTISINLATKNEDLILSKKLNEDYSAERLYDKFQNIFSEANQLFNKIKK